jgi:RIO kinase 1
MLEKEFNNITSGLKKEGLDLEVLGEIKSGKEATLFRAKLGTNLVAMKLYDLNSNLRTKDDYTQGKFYKTKSHEKSIRSRGKFGKKLSSSNWIKREFSIMKMLFEKNASLPRPILQLENAIFMEFLGDEMNTALRLHDIELDKDEAFIAFADILKNIKLFWENGIIHGDLSAYNILWWQKKIWIIDFPQAIDIRFNKEKESFLKRDLKNVCNYFEKYFPTNWESLYNQITLDQS